MGTSTWEKRIYELKNVMVSQMGPIGRSAEKVIARRWIADIVQQVDNAVQDNTVLSQQVISPKDYCAQAAHPRAALVVYGLAIGGGEIFPIHLANALQKAGVPVLLISCGMTEEDPKVCGLIDPTVPLIRLTHYRQLPQVLEAYQIEVVHTHHAVTDLTVSRAIETGKVTARQVVTLHGMYEALDKPRQKMLCEKVLQEVSCFAYIADKNLEPFHGMRGMQEVPFYKVPNGLPQGADAPIDRRDLHIPEDAFVLCLVSRARMEKGWKEAIETVRLVNQMHPNREVHLVLVGDGEAYDKLHGQQDRWIHFVGAKQNTRQYLAASDMGFLPSRYAGESFPLVIIDSFMCGKPVIATALGEVPTMVQSVRGAAGYTFALTEDGQIPVKKLARAIFRIVEEPERYEKMRRRTKECALRYDIQGVAYTYMDIYQRALAGQSLRKEPEVKVLISCHKPSQTPQSETLRPIQVGSAIADRHFADMLHDDEVDNISAQNRSYCEVTAQYWAYRNVQADYYGFFHYRRYLNLSDHVYPEDRYGNIYEPVYTDKLCHKYGWTDERIRQIVTDFDIITIAPRESADEHGQRLTVYEQYAAAPYLQEKDLQLVMRIITEHYPKYKKAMDSYLQGYQAYYCNMFICRADIFKSYCRWLFPVLEEFCQQTDLSGYDAQQLRTPGHIAERLWGVFYTYLLQKGGYRVKEAQCVVVSKTDNIGIVDKSLPVSALKKMVHGVVEK